MSSISMYITRTLNNLIYALCICVATRKGWTIPNHPICPRIMRRNVETLLLCHSHSNSQPSHHQQRGHEDEASEHCHSTRTSSNTSSSTILNAATDVDSASTLPPTLYTIPKHVIYNIMEYMHWDWFEGLSLTPTTTGETTGEGSATAAPARRNRGLVPTGPVWATGETAGGGLAALAGGAINSVTALQLLSQLFGIQYGNNEATTATTHTGFDDADEDEEDDEDDEAYQEEEEEEEEGEDEYMTVDDEEAEEGQYEDEEVMVEDEEDDDGDDDDVAEEED